MPADIPKIIDDLSADCKTHWTRRIKYDFSGGGMFGNVYLSGKDIITIAGVLKYREPPEGYDHNNVPLLHPVRL